MTSDEEEDYKPRYPDEVKEPEDLSSTRKPQKIVNMPIDEDEEVTVHRINEITDDDVKYVEKIGKVDSVEKVMKTKGVARPKKSEQLVDVSKRDEVAIEEMDSMMFERMVKPDDRRSKKITDVDKVQEEDECLLSVTEKVGFQSLVIV